jgi:hypothetical protein
VSKVWLGTKWTLQSTGRVKRTEALRGRNFGRNSPVDRAPKVPVGRRRSHRRRLFNQSLVPIIGHGRDASQNPAAGSNPQASRMDRFFVVARYVERNALRVNLINRAKQWRWGSLYWWLVTPEPRLRTSWPLVRLPNWVNRGPAAKTTPVTLSSFHNTINN